jgi:hypothetical protein
MVPACWGKVVEAPARCSKLSHHQLHAPNTGEVSKVIEAPKLSSPASADSKVSISWSDILAFSWKWSGKLGLNWGSTLLPGLGREEAFKEKEDC